MEKYTVGKSVPSWGGADVQVITFIVTEDCNLRCKYCYITHKSKGKVMALDTAKKFIDYVLTTDDIRRCESVILEFIGGEPLLEPELIENICDYFKIRSYEEQCSWYWNYRISIGTNGVNYNDEKVQRLIKKNKGKISVSITLDGTKEKHDLQRVFPDESGSFDIISKNVELWLKEFPGSTKVTFASDDLIYLKDSIIELWNRGITDVAANVVYEDVWKENDENIFEEQLRELADYVIDNNLYDKYTCTLFEESLGRPYMTSDLSRTSCGAGKMLALSPQGNIYPCMRYYDYSLNHKEGYIIGDVEHGIDMEKVRIFELVMYKYQCDDECLKCPVATGCEFCQGFNYDEADTETNFQRTKYICKMHKARVRANIYYFTKLFHQKGIRRENFWYQRQLYFLLNEDYIPVCSYENRGKHRKEISTVDLERGLEYAYSEMMQPVFLHSKDMSDELERLDFEDYDIMHILSVDNYQYAKYFYDYRLVFDLNSIVEAEHIEYQEFVFLNLKEEEIGCLCECVKKLLSITDRINLNIQNLDKRFDMTLYEKQLEQCADLLIRTYETTGEMKELSVLTDILFLTEHEGCPAGENAYTYVSNGEIYICPAFYSENKESIGNIESGIHNKNAHLLTLEYMPLCQVCDNNHCENCKYLNQKYTKEVNVSPSFQCMKAETERKVSQQLQERLINQLYMPNLLTKRESEDPILRTRENGIVPGYYK